VVLLFALIALVVMLIAAVALVRSFHTSLFTAGNIAFKRDLQNQGERASQVALTAFRSGGGLSTATLRATNVPGSNYSATKLDTNAQGVPDVLALSDSAFAAAYSVPDLKSDDQSVTIRYVIDRLCATTGDEIILGSGGCMLADDPTPPGNSSANQKGPEKSIGGKKGATVQSALYRLSVRVTGPRNTQSFFQSTFAVPSS
jgi:hypothetical protein